MKRFFRRLTAVLLIVLLLITSASALSVNEALELLDRHYVYEIPEEARGAETLDELFALLGDRYTYYMTAGEYDRFLNGVEGTQELVGIGVAIQLMPDGIYVTDVLSGGSALSAGIKPGDLIVAVDGVSCVPADESHRALIAGEEGTMVSLTVVRDGITFYYNLPRWRVVVPNTEFDLVDGNIGWIDCNSFGSDTGVAMTRGMASYEGLTDAWVLDLRGNGGGYTDSAITTLGLFSGPGVYLYLRNRLGGTQAFTYLEPAASEDPLIVLVDGSSASASEAVAAGIRDSGRGIVIGTRTFGKGVAQIVLDGETDPQLFGEDALKITAYRFYSQGTNTTDMIGVIPVLELDGPVAAQVARALCGQFRDDLSTDGQLMLKLAGQYFFLDMEDLPSDVASAFLSALPPGAQLWVGDEGFLWKEIDPADAAELLGAVYTPRRFDDVESSPYAREINTLANYSLLLGDGTGSFLPGQTLTRAQLCAMLAHVLNVTYEGPSRFSDVPADAWYAGAVNAMAQVGLVEGVGGGRFNPNGVLTQQECCNVLGRLARFLNFTVDDYSNMLTASDGTSLLPLYSELDGYADWAKENVAILHRSPDHLGKYGTMLPDSPEKLSPNAPITRELAALCLYRVLNFTGILPV